MQYQTLNLTIEPQGVARLALNRPRQYNALNRDMLAELSKAAKQLADNPQVRLVLMEGAGGRFCAGADLNWFRACAGMDADSRSRETRLLADALAALDSLPKPLVGLVQGCAYGGGIGLIAVCDYALGQADAQFALSEVRLGLVPANIAPYIVRRLGVSRARAVALSGARFNAAQALTWGLLDETCAEKDFAAARRRIIHDHLQAAPGAAAATKRLLGEVARHTGAFADLQQHTAEQLSHAWASPEGREGVQCFLERKQPGWQQTAPEGKEESGGSD